jgi:pimeloyl-ACP methyl ester carboxylesterase
MKGDSLERARDIKGELLMIWGRQDHIFPASHAEAASRRIKGAQLEIFEQSGHTPQMEEPERFNRLVLDFLRSPD